MPRTDVDYSGAYSGAHASGGGAGLTEVFADALEFQYSTAPTYTTANGFVYNAMAGFTNQIAYLAISLPADWLTFKAKVAWFLVGANVVDPMTWQLGDRFIATGDTLTFSWPAPNNAAVGDVPVANKLMETSLHATAKTNVPGKLYQLKLDVKGQTGNDDAKGFVGIRFIKES